MFPALTGIFLSTVPQGKFPSYLIKWNMAFRNQDLGAVCAYQYWCNVSVDHFIICSLGYDGQGSNKETAA